VVSEDSDVCSLVLLSKVQNVRFREHVPVLIRHRESSIYQDFFVCIFVPANFKYRLETVKERQFTLELRTKHKLKRKNRNPCIVCYSANALSRCRSGVQFACLATLLMCQSSPVVWERVIP
jgi:hypothetical protein